MPLEIYLRGRTYWARGRVADEGEYIRESLGTSDEALAHAEVRKIEEKARQRRILGHLAPRPEDEITFAECVLLYHASARDAGYLKPILKKLGSSRVRDITPASVRALARQMKPDAAVDTWQREIVTPISAVINNAHNLGKCAPIRIKRHKTDEIVKQDVRRGKRSREPKTPGSWPWVLAFSAAAKEMGMPRYGALAYFMFRHGYRISQSIEMTRRDDMDLGNSLVQVHASKGHAPHWVELDPEEVIAIANLPVPYRGQARDRVFTIAGGRSGALYRAWKAICAKAEIDYLPPHSCGRHGYGTEMIVRQAVDPVSAAEDKWSDPSVMLRTYAHSDDAKARVRDAFRVGLDAARTNPVQSKSGDGRKAKRANAKDRNA